MGDDANVKIVITGDASGGVQAAAQAEGAIKHLRVETDDLNDTTKRQLGLLDPLPDKVKGSAEATKMFAGEGREAHRIIGEINRILPGTGNLFREAFHPSALGAVGILVGLLYEAKTALDAYNKALDEQGADAAQSPLEAVKNLQTAWDDARKKFGEYLAAVHDPAPKDAIDEQVKKEKELNDARIEGLKKIFEAEYKATGDPRYKAALEGLNTEKTAYDQRELEREYLPRNAPMAQPVLDFKARQAGEAAAAAAAAQKDNESELEKLRDPAAIKKLKAEQDAAQAAVEAAQAMPEFRGTGMGGVYATGRQEILANAQSALDKANKDIADAKARQAQLKAEQTRLADQATAAAEWKSTFDAQTNRHDALIK